LAGNFGECGFQDGNGLEVKFNGPTGICLDSEGFLLVADLVNHRVRRVSLDGSVSTFTGSGERGNNDGNLEEAQFKKPFNVCTNGADIYVVDSICGLRKISNGKVLLLTLCIEKTGYHSPGNSNPSQCCYLQRETLHSHWKRNISRYFSIFCLHL
jgi:hypothetical protein